MPRLLAPLPVPTGAAVLDLLPRLRRAMDGDGPALLPVPAADPDAADAAARALDAGSPLGAAEDDDHDPTAFAVGTSGSTGVPKGVLLPASALVASARATRELILGSDPRPAHWLLALPAHHVAGLQVLLRSVAEGTTPTVLDTGSSFTPDRFRAAVDAMPSFGPRLVSLVPTQLLRILDDEAASAALAGFAGVLIGGAPSPDALLTAAAAAGIRAVTTYGMSETCGGCVYDGRPLAGVRVTTDDAGRISLAGPVVARGYRGRPDDPAFRLENGRRLFRTDDLGTRVDGRWRILGRADDVLITGGVNVAPAPVEATLSEVPGVAEAVLTGVPDVEWGQRLVAVVVPAGSGPDRDALRAAVRDAHGAAAVPRELLLVNRLPLRGPGKPDRAAIRELATRALARRSSTRS